MIIAVTTSKMKKLSSWRKTLHSYLMHSNYGKRIFISGPIPSLGRGSGCFSRLLNLHSWLQEACLVNQLCFIDNFNLFWNRPSFYRNNGIHPSRLGSQILSYNVFYFVLNLKWLPEIRNNHSAISVVISTRPRIRHSDKGIKQKGNYLINPANLISIKPSLSPKSHNRSWNQCLQQNY